MHRSSLLGAATAATALLVAPAGALAAGTVIAGPVKVKGYALTVTATDAAAGDSLSVTAVKSAGGSQQLHSWTFQGAKVTLKGATATIKGSLGRYGAINAKVRGAGKVKGRVPAGCTGNPGSARKGTLAGKTKLVLDSTFFKTVKPKAVKAQILKAGKLECGGGGSTDTEGLMLMSSLDGPDGMLSVSVVKAGSHVTQTVTRMDPAASTAPASVFHMITASTGEAGLHAAPDLQNASAPAAGPFLLGQLAFAGTPMGTMSTGTISGDFAAKFDSIGQQWLPEGNDAMLMQR